jgi:hypothetical protein
MSVRWVVVLAVAHPKHAFVHFITGCHMYGAGSSTAGHEPGSGVAGAT